MPREGASGDHGLAHTQAGRGTGEVAAESPALAPLPPWGFGKAVPAPVGRWQGGPPGLSTAPRPGLCLTEAGGEGIIRGLFPRKTRVSTRGRALPP